MAGCGGLPQAALSLLLCSLDPGGAVEGQGGSSTKCQFTINGQNIRVNSKQCQKNIFYI
jgi:hypothetical protein